MGGKKTKTFKASLRIFLMEFSFLIFEQVIYYIIKQSKYIENMYEKQTFPHPLPLVFPSLVLLARDNHVYLFLMCLFRNKHACIHIMLTLIFLPLHKQQYILPCSLFCFPHISTYLRKCSKSVYTEVLSLFHCMAIPQFIQPIIC